MNARKGRIEVSKSSHLAATELAAKSCAPCNKQTPRLKEDTVKHYLNGLSDEWYQEDGRKIKRKFKVKDFKANLRFVNSIAKLADEEGHHPDLCLSWDILEVILWTHAIGGLSENDFILAAKIDKLYETFVTPSV